MAQSNDTKLENEGMIPMSSWQKSKRSVGRMVRGCPGVGNLLHVRAFLAQRNRGQSEIRQLYDGPSFSPCECHQEGKHHGHRYGKKARRHFCG